MMVCWDHLSTGVGVGAAVVGLAGLGGAGCLAGVTGAVGCGFSGSMDGLSRVAGVAVATVGAALVASETAVGVGGSNSLASSVV